MRLVEQFNLSVEDIGYKKLLELLSGHEYASGEVCVVGGGLIGEFNNTKELKVMKFDEAMDGKDRNKWLKAVEKEFDRFEKNCYFEPIERKDIDPVCTVITSSWTMKKKAS